MKTRTLALLTGVAAPLIHAATASAGFTGLSTVSKPNVFDILTVNVYAEFDRPGEDHMLAVAGTLLTTLNITAPEQSIDASETFAQWMGMD